MYSLGCLLKRWLLDMFVVVTVVVAVMMTMGMGELDAAIADGQIAYGFSNDGCNGSSSENECNGNLDLSHF